MLREPEKSQSKSASGNEAVKKTGRFRIVKLEERIAPGKGNGNGSNNTCGNACNGGSGGSNSGSSVSSK